MRRLLFALLLCMLPLASQAQTLTLPLSGVQAPQAFLVIVNDFRNIKSAALLIQQKTAGAGSVNAIDVLDMAMRVMVLQGDWNTFQPNTILWNAVIANAQNSFGNTLITANTFQNVFAAAGNLLTATMGEFPQDTASPPHLLDRTWNGSTIGNVTLTAAQLPNTLAAITAFLATLS